MGVEHNDFTTLARQMRDFFNAVDWRTDPSAQAAAAEIEAFHGAGAAIEAIVRACEHRRNDEAEACTFWMKVYGLLVAPEAHMGGEISVH